MKQEEFLDHKLVATKSLKVKFTDSSNQSLSIREVVWFSYGKSREYDTETTQELLVCHSEEIWCRYTYSTMEPWKKIKPLKRGAFVVEPQQLYHSRLPIKKAKYNYLVKLSEKSIFLVSTDHFTWIFQLQRERKLTLKVHLNSSSI